MATLDWIIIGSYVLAMLGLGAWLSRRAGRSAEDYLIAGRKLPWWVIGVSDVAGMAGADAIWIMMIFAGGFMALFQTFWIGAVFALPLAVLWARYWRRLRLLSPGQFYEERYHGRAAGRFRGLVVVYGALVTSAIILAYVLQIFAGIMAPFMPQDWSAETTLAVFAGASMLYTMMAGLLGVTYSDVPQFVLVMSARLILAALVVDAAGGFEQVIDQVTHQRGEAFLQATPPTDALKAAEGTWGAYTIDGMSLVALGLFGLLNANAQSASVQRSLAARSELDAALGQMLNAVLTLALRFVPVILLGLCAVALFAQGEDGQAMAESGPIKPMALWAHFVDSYAGPGLKGLLLVGIIAGSMSSIDTFLNFMTAGLFNDYYKRHLRPQASPREQVLFCRVSTLICTGVAFLWAQHLIGEVGHDWIRFINTVVMLFLVPLTLLRWIWWRLNIWGEITAFMVAYPMAYVVWFPLDFKAAPYWQSFLLLAGGGWALVVLVTLCTRPEPMAQLRHFFTRVRPPGWWGPLRREQSTEHREAQRQELRCDLWAALAGSFFCISLVLAVTTGLSLRWPLFMGALGGVLLSGGLFVTLSQRGERWRRRLAALDEAQHAEVAVQNAAKAHDD